MATQEQKSRLYMRVALDSEVNRANALITDAVDSLQLVHKIRELCLSGDFDLILPLINEKLSDDWEARRETPLGHIRRPHPPGPECPYCGAEAANYNLRTAFGDDGVRKLLNYTG